MPITTFGLNTGNTGGVECVQLREDTPDTNYDSQDYLEMFNWAAGDTGHVLFRFTGVPAAISVGSTINSVTLRLRLSATYNAATGYTIAAYRSLRAWVAAQATWNVYSTGNNWATAGGQGGADASGSASATLLIGNGTVDNWYTWGSTASLIADMQAAVDAGANPSWIMARTDAVSAATRQFYAENAADGYRPELVVDWSAASSSRRKVLLALM